MPGRAALFDVCPAPLFCGERASALHVGHVRLRPGAFAVSAERVARDIRRANLWPASRERIAGIVLGGDAARACSASQQLDHMTRVAVALGASIPVDIETPHTVTAENVASFVRDDRSAKLGLIIPLDAPSAWSADDPALWTSLRGCLRVDLDDRGGTMRSIGARLSVGVAPDRAVLEIVASLRHEDHISCIALISDRGTRAGHVERVAHAIDAMWTMELSPADIPCDALGVVLSPQEVDRAIIATLRKSVPIDVASAEARLLARVPGVGRAAYQIVAAREAGLLNQSGDFSACGVDLDRASSFLRHHAL